jgi:PAS domain S-box-containing protein
LTGGIHSPVISALPLAIVFSGWLLGARGAVQLGVASVALLVAYGIADQYGMLSPAVLQGPPWRTTFAEVCVVVSASVLGYYAARSVGERIARLRAVERNLLLKYEEAEAARESARSLHDRFERLFRSSPVGTAIADPRDGTVIDCNAAFLDLVGRPRAQIVGRTAAEAGYWVDLGQRAIAYEVLDRTGTVRGFEADWWTAAGERRTCLIHWERIDLDGAPHLLAQCMDITERKRIEQALRASEQALAALNAQLEARVQQRTSDLTSAVAELNAFAYSVAHDLRAPVRAIDGFTALLAEHLADRLDTEAWTLFERVRRNAQRMGTLIDDLLDLSRVSRVDLRSETVDLSAVAREISATLAATDPSRSVAWRIAPGVRVTADPGLMRIALDNLLGNAWKYTRPVAAAQVEFGAAESGDGGPAFEVRDNGVGFDTAHAGQLFQPFQRLHHESEFEGTGIGLATVARIVRRHGGDVQATSEPGQGTTVRVRLPASAMPTAASA